MIFDVLNCRPRRLAASYTAEIPRSSFKPHRVNWRGKRMSWCSPELLEINASVREIERREDERIKRIADAAVPVT